MSMNLPDDWPLHNASFSGQFKCSPANSVIVTHSYPDCTSESGSRRALLTTSGCPPHTASRRQASLRASQRHGPWPLHGDAHSPAPGQSILFMFRS